MVQLSGILNDLFCHVGSFKFITICLSVIIASRYVLWDFLSHRKYQLKSLKVIAHRKHDFSKNATQAKKKSHFPVKQKKFLIAMNYP